MSANGSSRFNASHEAGFVAMTRDDLERQRSERRAEAREVATRLSSMNSTKESPAVSSRQVSRLDSMRNALGLNKLSSAIANRTRRSTPGAAEDCNNFDLFPSMRSNGGSVTTSPPPTRQFSSGRASFGNGGSTPSPDKPSSGWGRMFSKK